MNRVLVIGPGVGDLPGPDVVTMTFIPADGVPRLEEVRNSDIVLIVGQLTNHHAARQLAGVLKLAIDSAIAIVVAYPSPLGAEDVVIAELCPAPKQEVGGPLSTEPRDAAFREYLTIFGSTSWAFNGLPPHTQILGVVQWGGQTFPTAWKADLDGTPLYVVPYQLAGAAGFVETLLDAVREHRSGGATGVPPFLTDLRLAPEQELLDEIASREEKLEELRAQATEFAEFRQLVGHLSGDRFEQLVIQALNVVLEGSGHRAEDRADL